MVSSLRVVTKYYVRNHVVLLTKRLVHLTIYPLVSECRRLWRKNALDQTRPDRLKDIAALTGERDRQISADACLIHRRRCNSTESVEFPFFNSLVIVVFFFFFFFFTKEAMKYFPSNASTSIREFVAVTQTNKSASIWTGGRPCSRIVSRRQKDRSIHNEREK